MSDRVYKYGSKSTVELVLVGALLHHYERSSWVKSEVDGEPVG